MIDQRIELPDADATVAAGRRIGAVLRAGDLVVLIGDLGAGKTTLARGIGQALGVRGALTSPTFVLARRHPSLVGGPDVVHADLYRTLDRTLDRTAADADLDDLDLADPTAVTLVEWGRGRVDDLAGGDRLEITLDVEGTGRVLTVVGIGARWHGSTPPPAPASGHSRTADGPDGRPGVTTRERLGVGRRVLALDTATAATTAAALSARAGGVEVHAEDVHVDPRRHGEVLAPMVRDVLDAAGWAPRSLDLIAVGVGPGPFTGLRVGIAFAQAAGLALGIPVVGVSTLAAIAAGAGRLDPTRGQVAVAVRTRRVEVAWARYALATDRAPRLLTGPEVRGIDDLGGEATAGDAADAVSHPVAPIHPSAVDIARLALEFGSAVDTEQIVGPPAPSYLRRPDAVPGVGR